MQHETLLRVRKEGNAHEKYNSFRSAFEILETIGKPPADDLGEHYERPVSLLAKVETLEQRMPPDAFFERNAAVLPPLAPTPPAQRVAQPAAGADAEQPAS